MPLEFAMVTPRGVSYRGPVECVVLPGAEGDFGVLPSHERFITPLRIGEVMIRTASDTIWGAIADSGFAVVDGDELTVLVESCELAHEIDVARAEHARERAEQGLAQLGVDEDAERFRQFEAALERAKNRLAVSRKSGR